MLYVVLTCSAQGSARPIIVLAPLSLRDETLLSHGPLQAERRLQAQQLESAAARCLTRAGEGSGCAENKSALSQGQRFL
jgi:hypothetical protein